MVRHFLSAFFFAFIGHVIFINLFQFSGAIVPFEMPFDEFTNEGIFGFTSLINFVHTIGGDEGIQSGLTALKTGFSIIKSFSIDSIVATFTLMREQNGNIGLIIAALLSGFINVIINGLILPFTTLIGLIVMVFGVILFLWQLISIFIKFLLGYYNYIPVTSGLLNSTGFLIYCIPMSLLVA